MTDRKRQSPTPNGQRSHPPPDECQIDSMRTQLRELTFLHETSQVLTATLDLESVLQSLMSQVRDYFQVEAASVALLDDETGELVFRVAVGEAADEALGLRLTVGQGVAGWVVETGQPALVPTAHSDSRFYSGIDDRTDFYTRTMLAVPIKIEGRALGVIEALNPAAGTFDDDAQRLLLAVAELAAAAIRNAELYERVWQAERRYESLFSESLDCILVLDLEGRILDLNQRAVEMLKHPYDQLIGVKPQELFGIPPETYHEALQQLRGGERLTLRTKTPSEEGSCTLETHMAKIDYGGRQAILWVGHDISERVALEQMREDVTHMIVHDLRNPLGSIMSSLQLIHAASIEDDETLPVMQLSRIAIRSGQKMYRLIESLLDLGRLDAGETELKKTPVNPEALAREAIEQIQPLTLNRKQTLTMQSGRDVPEIPADRDLILRVLTNLLDNAVKFTPREGHITLQIERREEGVLFAVSDTGLGISPEYRERIFDRFARPEHAKGIKGTGLGLAFCKLAVEAHGGRIWVESEPDQGTTFYFILPVEAE
jgi:NtrC-family two-component system sensor histidine kinase KinB